MALSPALLRKSILSVLEEATRLGAETIALPAVSGGIFGFPLQLCIDVILSATCDFLISQSANGLQPCLRFVRFVATNLSFFASKLLIVCFFRNFHFVDVMPKVAEAFARRLTAVEVFFHLVLYVSCFEVIVLKWLQLGNLCLLLGVNSG